MYASLMRGCGGVAAAVLGGIAALVCFDVVSRNLGFRSVVWINEVTEYALPVATLAAAPWLMWRNMHVRLDLLGMVLSSAVQRKVDRISSALGLLVSCIVVWYSIRMLMDSRAAGSIVLKALVFPEWWLYIPVPIGFGLLALECGRRLIWPTSLLETGQPA